MSEDTLMTFPHDYPLKVMGRNTEEFRSVVLGIVQKHMGPVDASKIEERPSRDGTYLGLTCIVVANSKAQLDALYLELTSCERVMVAL
jgi:putative lipoic acid-binding regulatory protein